jgi:hypothetical protein
MLTRSRRIAAQSLSRIPVSKRGEFLVMKRLGQARGMIDASPAPSTKYDDIFGEDPENMEALRELFPEDGAVGGRKRRRRHTARA